MLKLFASLLFISTTLCYPIEDCSEIWLHGLLGRSRRRAPFNLTLRVRSESPSTLTLLPGSSSQFLECEVGGHPSPTIHWMKDGQRLSQSEVKYNDVASMLGLSIIRSRLYLDDVTPDQAGLYTCVGKSCHYSRNETFTVRVADRNEENSTANEDGKPARITTWVDSTLDLQGTDIQLFCRSEGSPSPTVVWFHPNRTKVQESERFQLKENGDLVIKNLSWADMGSYSCQSENARGSDYVHSFVYPLLPKD